MAEAGVSCKTGGEQALVRIRHLNHAYGEGAFRNQVLFDNTLDLMPGEIAIMTGPSGSGKTTLLTLIGALRSVQEGSLQVNGRELSGLSRRELVAVRRNIGFIFQAHNLFESLSAFQNVMMALELHPYTRHEVHERATDMLTRLGLGHRMYYKPHAMSGGQRQRVAIARALVNRPSLILADEPTAALDKDSGRDAVDLLRQLAKEAQATVLIVTHDNRILDVADRIVSMVDGRIISNVVVQESVGICEFLMQCPVFSELNPTTLSAVADEMRQERYAAGSEIIRQGDEGDKFYLIRRGIADVIVDDGVSRTVDAILGEGEFFGEAALLTGEPRNATVQAREDMELYSLSKDDFQAVLNNPGATFKEQLMNIFFQRQ